MKVNDIVLLIGKNKVRGEWPLGRVIEVFPGADGHVRVVKVQRKSGEFVRSITKLCPLEIVD